MSQQDENSASGEQEEKIEVDVVAETKRVREMFREGLTHLSRTADNSTFAFS